MLCALDVLLVTALLGAAPDCTCSGDTPPISLRLKSSQWVFLGGPAAPR